MLKNIIGIKFKGAAFEDETTLKLFSEDEVNRVSLIFGRNGSGKSTISRAISKAMGNEEIEDILFAKFVDSSNSDITIDVESQQHIFVFNEDYINRSVRLKEDGLNTIVMFGEIGDIEDKIEKTSKNLDKVLRERDIQQEKYSEYEDNKNINSPENHLEKVKTKLKGNKSWADRERLILGSKANAAVTDFIVCEIMKNIPTESQLELMTAYESAFLELEVAKNSDFKIITPIPIINDYTNQITVAKNLLAEKIEEPILNEREKKLLILAQSGKQSMLSDMKTEFQSETNICPFCLQSITDEYKLELIKSIEKVLSKSVEEHKIALEKSKIELVSLNIGAFEPVDKETTENCRKAIKNVNSKIMEYNQVVEQKIDNLYTPIIDFTSELQGAVDVLKTFLFELDQKKKQYNDRIENIQKIKDNLKILNKKCAYYEIKDIYSDYLKQKSEKVTAKSKLDELNVKYEETKNELNNLYQKKKNVKIAVDFINRGLQYVFFSENRLTVFFGDEKYLLLSNNKPVKPKNISVGERNILALCYFFTELLNNVDEKNIYEDDCFIVLDDPVSSFDLEHRVGIISYLKSQLSKVLIGNSGSKILLLSHDLLTIYDVDKALNEVVRQMEIKGKGQKKFCKYLELDKRRLADFNCKNRNEYSQLLKMVYEYASKNSDEYEIVIGNIMRRLLEAFGTFEFRKGIAEISCDQNILSNISVEKRDYFENLMYRLILNGESHLEERAKSITDNNFFATITADEKRRTAKDVLCLIYLLNGNHIKAQFDAMDDLEDEAISNIEKWVRTINAS